LDPLKDFRRMATRYDQSGDDFPCRRPRRRQLLVMSPDPDTVKLKPAGGLR
jgi:hypothetical protein